MNELSLNALIHALSQSLMHFLWQGALVGIVTALALRMLKHARPQLRYALCYGALLVCVLAALSTLFGLLATTGSFPLTGANVNTGALLSASGPAGEYRWLGSHTVLAPSISPWLVALWAAGASWMLLRLAVELSGIQRLYTLPLAPAEWQQRLDVLATRFGLRQVTLRISDALASPISAGFLRPMVLFPTGLLLRLPVAQVEALLAHELAHIRRHDYLLNLLQALIESALFYHPVIWWLAKQIRQEREQIADQLAAEVMGTPRHLAHALATLAELQAPSYTLAQAAHSGALETRIKQLFRTKSNLKKPAGASARWVLLALALTLSAIASMACAQLVQDQAAQPALATQKSDRLSFALVRRGGEPILAWGPDDEIDQDARLLPAKNQDYVLLRRNRRDSVVLDADAVAPLRNAWEHAESLTHQAEKLEIRLQRQHRRLQRSADRISTQVSIPDAMIALEDEQRLAADLERQIAQVMRDQAHAYQHVEQLLHQSIAVAPTLAP